MELKITDINGKEINSGHIVAVRYVWNSYVGVARERGLCAESPDIDYAFASPHAWGKSATYQILGHTDKSHPDYNNDVYLWYYHGYSKDDCPVDIRIYENMPTE